MDTNILIHNNTHNTHTANRVMAETLAHAATKLLDTIKKDTPVCLSTDALLTAAGLDHVNPYTLLHWAAEHKIVHKAAGAYASHISSPTTSRGSLYALLTFLRAVGNDAGQGCVLCNDDENQSLRYILLDASVPFADVVARAHSVVLASGTLSPIDALTAQLWQTPSNIAVHSFDHVVPPSNLCTTIVSTGGPHQHPLDLRFATRNTPETLQALRSTVQALSDRVPHGMVVFFPSFKYMHAAIAAGVGRTAKPMWSEPKDAAAVPRVLAAYAAAAARPTGALLLSVCGGKLSEGINFGDELGRCVVVVGLPYPDAHSPELQQRLAFAGARGVRRAVYDGACFTAVNQCVGRVLRHARDYAAIVLLDGRYGHALDKLPRWVVAGGVPVVGADEAVQRVARFFDARALCGGTF